MNRALYTLLLVTVVAVLFGQVRQLDPTPLAPTISERHGVLFDAARSVADTPIVYFPTWEDACSESLNFYGITNNWGFVSGMNEFMDLAKAQRLEFTDGDSYKILGGLAYFSLASIVDNGMLKMDFYAEDAINGGPGELLASSMPISVSDIVEPDTFIRATFFVIPPESRPNHNEPEFYASVDLSALYATADTVALFQTEIEANCGDGTNTFERVVANNGDTVWVDIMTTWSINADFALAAIVEFDPLASDEAFVKRDGLILYPATPNPAQDLTILHFELENPSAVRIDVFDSQGKLIQQFDEDTLLRGRHIREIPLTTLAPGTYYYVLTTDKGSIASRFIRQ